MAENFSYYIACRYMRSSQHNQFALLIQRISICAISLGVAILVIISSIFNGFHHEIEQSLTQISPHIVLTHRAYLWKDWQKIAQKCQKIPVITSVKPKIRTYGMSISATEPPAPVQIIATIQSPQIQEIAQDRSSKTEEDTFFPEAIAPMQATISADLQADLLLDKGDRLSIFTVDPLAESTKATTPLSLRLVVDEVQPHTQLSQRSILVTQAALAEQLPAYKDHITELAIDTQDVYQVTQTIKNLQDQLPNDIQIKNASSHFMTLLASLSMQKRMMTTVLSLVVIIAACNLITSLVMIVTERRQEIALMRTIGASRHCILKIFLLQSILLAIRALIIGLILGIIISIALPDTVRIIEEITNSKIISDQVFMLNYLPTQIKLLDCVIIAICTLVLAVISALYPAFIAGKVDPATIMRYE